MPRARIPRVERGELSRVKEHAYVILGATGGIGSSLCRRIKGRGGRLLLAARDEAKLAALSSELDAPYMALDAAEPADVKVAIERCKEAHGRFDGIVNSVGSILLRPAHMTKVEDFDATVRTNLRSAFATVHAGAAALRRSGGSIVLVSTAAARTGLPNHEAIAAAKAGAKWVVRSEHINYQVAVDPVPEMIRESLLRDFD